MGAFVVVTPEELKELMREVRREENPTGSVGPALLKRDDIAAALGVSPSTVDNWRKLGMPCVQPPGSVPRFILADCLDWVRTHKKTTND